MNDFHRDDAWQKSVRGALLVPGFYKQYAQEGRYVFIDKGRLAKTLQKRYAVDTIYQDVEGGAVCIEEKIVRWPGYQYRSFCLETDSCTVPGHESQGWMHYGEADYLLYCFHQETDSLSCYLIDFKKLQEWFWSISETFSDFYMKNTLNKTKGKVVPIADVEAAVPTYHYQIGERPKATIADRLF